MSDQYERQKRRYFQKIRSTTFDKFWHEMNMMHTRAYAKAEQHYQEAMDIVLTPKKKAEVLAKAAEIRELWDGMTTITVDDTKDVEFKPVEVKQP